MEILKWPILKIQICEQSDIHTHTKKKNLDQILQSSQKLTQNGSGT